MWNYLNQIDSDSNQNNQKYPSVRGSSFLQQKHLPSRTVINALDFCFAAPLPDADSALALSKNRKKAQDKKEKSQ